RLGVPAIAIVGSTGPGADQCLEPASGGRLTRYISLEERYGLDRALGNTAALIEEASEDAVRAWPSARGE
ncbi:MAG: hypothetical protein SYC29_09120, partial [Planctomycetota bacterium]|nr:hypothetical protein [Planctomycetota bacterium]